MFPHQSLKELWWMILLFKSSFILLRRVSSVTYIFILYIYTVYTVYIQYIVYKYIYIYKYIYLLHLVSLLIRIIYNMGVKRNFPMSKTSAEFFLGYYCIKMGFCFSSIVFMMSYWFLFRTRREGIENQMTALK